MIVVKFCSQHQSDPLKSINAHSAWSRQKNIGLEKVKHRSSNTDFCHLHYIYQHWNASGKYDQIRVKTSCFFLLVFYNLKPLSMVFFDFSQVFNNHQKLFPSLYMGKNCSVHRQRYPLYWVEYAITSYKISNKLQKV